MRYLKNNPGQGLFFRRDSKLQLMGYSDADWAGCVDLGSQYLDIVSS
jgi:hypothetical protein